MSTRENPPEYDRILEATEFAPRVVFSTGDFQPEWENTRVAHNLQAPIAHLRPQKGKDIIARGGATLAGSLIREGLVNEYRLELNPTLLGGGKRLFAGLPGRRPLQLLDAKPSRSGNVLLRYQAAST